MGGGHPIEQRRPLGCRIQIAHARYKTGDFLSRLLQNMFPPAANDDAIARFREPFRERQADAGASAGDQDRISREPHVVFSSNCLR